MLKIVILCGGIGTRLWPLSRENFPKQFNTLINKHSLFQETLLRNLPLKNTDSLIEVVSNEQYHFLLQNQSLAIGVELNSLILEALPKNTAAAIAFSAFNANHTDTLLILPSDHFIKDTQNYLYHVKQAISLAQQNYLVTFGIKPTSAHTGYGYIQSINGIVKKFVEKPNSKLAQEYFNTGEFYWNSGMFCFKAGVFLEELKLHAPKIYQETKNTLKFAIKKDQSLFLPALQSNQIPSSSIDYAVLEKSSKVYCLASNFLWNDVGSFDSLSQESSISTSSQVVTQSSKNNFVISDKLVAMIDIKDLIVVDTPDSLLISKKDSSEKVKEIYPQIKTHYPELAKNHQITYRPWGSYQVLLETQTYKIKKIVVKPHSRLSLQKHFHRNEHWIIVSGSAFITLEDKNFSLHPNQSTYIPMGQIHRLANLGKIDLVVIEVQMGEYLGEDDIIRIEDDFYRE